MPGETSTDLPAGGEQEQTLESASQTEAEDKEDGPTAAVPGEGSCLIDGVTYGSGVSVPTSSQCQISCVCSNSVMECKTRSCPVAPTGNCRPYYTKGSCCPAYDCSNTVEPPVTLQCYLDGVIHDEGDVITHPDPCKYCLCLSGEVVCATQVCRRPDELEGMDCRPLAAKAGQCCPSEYSCDISVLESLNLTASELPGGVSSGSVVVTTEGPGQEVISVSTAAPDVQSPSTEGPGIEQPSTEKPASTSQEGEPGSEEGTYLPLPGEDNIPGHGSQETPIDSNIDVSGGSGGQGVDDNVLGSGDQPIDTAEGSSQTSDETLEGEDKPVEGEEKPTVPTTESAEGEEKPTDPAAGSSQVAVEPAEGDDGAAEGETSPTDAVTGNTEGENKPTDPASGSDQGPADQLVTEGSGSLSQQGNDPNTGSEQIIDNEIDIEDVLESVSGEPDAGVQGSGEDPEDFTPESVDGVSEAGEGRSQSRRSCCRRGCRGC
ncbi:spore wall protein 2-like [Pollicipes pollicipes]|uniref:spore wall protein 2-like n=1 Tax=Pollicipes pollicipes TaxID=41117 RepID=UPI001884F216|nr:spore wall protein 2-like [Pollicipes pollicipes]XP_037078355.1 spore wall protein 2-like [Pollicipes pollicipes]